MAGRKMHEVTVINSIDEQVYRGAQVFGPRQERTVKVTDGELAEIKACRALSIFHGGIPCDYPGCGFIAKSDRALYAHKRKHKKQKKGGGDLNDE